jgi:hypothetical protein
MPLRNLSQRSWIKGLSANFDTLSQPKQTVPRVSNYLLTRRGGWATCDGTQLVSALNGVLQAISANIGPITALFLYQPVGGQLNYFLIRKDYNTHLASPTGLAAVDGGTGGNLSAGAYQWAVTALDGAGGETLVSAAATLTLAASHKANLTWNKVVNATGYNVYRTIAGGSTLLLVNGATPVTGSGATISYTDNVADANLGTQGQPTANSTQVCQFQLVPPTSYGAANIVFTFPADNLIFQPGGGGVGGGYGGGVSGGSGGSQSPGGGQTGTLSPLPQIIQFANLMFLALGNGVSPYTSDGTTGNTIPITNTFQATFPSWQATTGFSTGDQITVTVSGTAYVFTAVQGGVTSGSMPTFPSVLDQQVADGNIIWQNAGKVSTSPAPRGAAHVEYYAGSLWVANTSPQITTDQLDGPSALRMSDANNPNSWNPLNAAQVARDDGTQISGIKAFAVAAAGIPTTNQLAVFKDFSLYVINGVFGAADFAIQQAQTDMGCSAARSIQYLPGFGLIRLTHLGFAIFDGLYDKLVSEELRPYLFGGQSDILPVDWNYAWFSKGSQVTDPPMYVCACPVIQNPTTTLPPMPITAGTGTLPSATYYVIVQKVGANGAIAQTAEVSVGPCTGINITLPSVAPFNYTWRILFGPTSGAENFIYYYSAMAFNVLRIQSFTGVMTGVIGSSLGQLTRVFCYDLVLKGWTVVDLPFPLSILSQVRTIGTIPITLMAGFWDGAIRRWQAGDANWDAGATNAFAPDLLVRSSLRSAEVYQEGGSQPTYFRRIVIRGVGAVPITVTPCYNGNDALAITAAFRALGIGQFEAQADLQQTVRNFHATIAAAGPSEIDSIDHEVVEKAVGAPIVIS